MMMKEEEMRGAAVRSGGLEVWRSFRALGGAACVVCTRTATLDVDEVYEKDTGECRPTRCCLSLIDW